MYVGSLVARLIIFVCLFPVCDSGRSRTFDSLLNTVLLCFHYLCFHRCVTPDSVYSQCVCDLQLWLVCGVGLEDSFPTFEESSFDQTTEGEDYEDESIDRTAELENEVCSLKLLW